MKFLEINSKDYSEHVQPTTYRVNAEKTCEQWEDADNNRHFSDVVEHVNGSFEMVFIEDQDLTDFLAEIELGTYNNLTSLRLYIGNKNEVVDCECYVQISSIRNEEISATKVYKRMLIEVTGR